MSRLLVAGLGSELHGDDEAGLVAVRELRRLGSRGADLLEAPADTLTLAAAIADHEEVVLVDSIPSDCAPGEVVELPAGAVAVLRSASGHGVSAGDAVELARALGTNPVIHIVGITGSRFELGSPADAAVRRAAREVARWIKRRFTCA